MRRHAIRQKQGGGGRPALEAESRKQPRYAPASRPRQVHQGARPHHGARPPNHAARTEVPPAPHPPVRCPGVKRRKRPQETLGRLHSLGNGGCTQDQPGSIALPHRKCRRVPPGRPLPRPLRFPAGLDWAGGSKGQPLVWASLSLLSPFLFVWIVVYFFFF